jgi:ankyrin repeat protein
MASLDQIKQLLATYSLNDEVAANNFSTMELILEVDPTRIDELTGEGYSPIMTATAAGNLEIMNYLLSQYSPNLTIIAAGEVNILHVAVQSKSADAIYLLLQQSRELINRQDQNKFTPLNLLYKWSSITDINLLIITTQLLTAGADGNITDGDGNTPLHYIASQVTATYTQLYLINLLKKNGVLTNVVNNNEQLARDIARDANADDIIIEALS